MDVGDASYQQAWLANVLADLRSRRWDGVMLDDVNESETWHLCGRTIARYPTADAYTAATESFLARRRARLCAARASWPCRTSRSTTGGRRTAWPAGIAGSLTRRARSRSTSRSGAAIDSRWLTDDGTHSDWSGRQALFARTQAAGKTFIGVTYAPVGDVRSMRYARASFLLDWNGGPSALAFEPTTPEAQDPYFEDWTTDVGAPTGARVQVGVAWKRDFSDGIVVLDPSPSTSQTVSLDGQYVLPGGDNVNSVTVGPTEAVLLTTPSGTARPAPRPHPTSPPANTARPTIAAAKSGRALTASVGSWSDATTFTYRWLRCDRRGDGCTAISGASSSRYTFGTVDVGKRLRVSVTAGNAGGSATSTSAPTKRLNAPQRLAHRLLHDPARGKLRRR